MYVGTCAGVTELLPKWVAPNLITLTGMFALFYSYALSLWYLPALAGEP